jgi:hypothetical protein
MPAEHLALALAFASGVAMVAWATLIGTGGERR